MLNFLKNKNTKERIISFIETFLLFIIVVVPIRFFVFEPFLVQGQSMEPNFHNFDYLIIDKLSYRFKQPERGEVVIFKPPFDNRVYYLKRIIGLPKERILIEGNKIIIFNREHPNGFVLKENYLKSSFYSNKVDITLKDNEYFVLGDNREYSFDSRKWGAVTKERIIGRVALQISLFKLTQALSK